MKSTAISQIRNDVLAIYTADKTLAVAINGRALIWKQDQHYSDHLLENIDTLLAEVKVKPTNVKGVVVATGPGSFTGLRVGATVANGIGYANNIGVAGVTLFDLIKSSRPAPKLNWVILDAGRGEVFVAHSKKLELLKISELNDRIKTGDRVYIDTPDLVAKVHPVIKNAGTIVFGPVTMQEKLDLMVKTKIPAKYWQVLPTYLREANITLKNPSKT
ncbi:MAG: tRNA (adenosine(37)-N6)-threonylcarbamoyltransferase complex dimerization subunit type 1 TsaB [Patescibacteria group bacterium]